MPKIDNEKFYSSAIEKFGTTAKGVNWHSSESQRLRFKIILTMLPDDMSSHTIVDAGCGFGDFYTYLKKKKRAPMSYIGIDLLPDMYSIASSKTGCEIIIADICRDALPSTDYYVCSGAMNVLESFETHLFMRNCFASSKIGFIFNVLHGDKESETYNYMTTEQIMQIAADLGVKSVIIRDDYMDGDITVGFFKERTDL